MRRKYHLLDVFTEKLLSGNQLAVVVDSEGLDSGQMQAIAREFNLPETVFVLPAQNPINLAALRIFTPGRELPFAGHPTVGAAVLLARLNAQAMLARQDVNFSLEEPIGTIDCVVRQRPGRALRASFTLPRLPAPAGALGARADIARALGLDQDEIGYGAHQPMRFSAGVPFAFVPLRSRAALARVTLDYSAWAAAFGGGGREPVYLYCAEPEGEGHHFRARMFAPDMGIAEDPATGSAAAAFAGVIMMFEPPSEGEHLYVIEQGFEMGRPSLIVLGLEVDGGGLSSATIGGGAVIIGEGYLAIQPG